MDTSTTATDPEVLASAGLDKPAATTADVKKERRNNGALETQIKAITDSFVKNEIDLNGQPLTPYRIAKLVDEKFGGPTKTSTGAVTECLKRWREYGFATLAAGDDTPMAFDNYTDDARLNGLKALKANYRERNKAAKDAAKAAAAPVSATATPAAVAVASTSASDLPEGNWEYSEGDGASTDG